MAKVLALFIGEITHITDEIAYIQFFDSDGKESLARMSIDKMINKYDVFPIRGMWVAILIQEIDGKIDFNIAYTEMLPYKRKCISISKVKDVF